MSITTKSNDDLIRHYLNKHNYNVHEVQKVLKKKHSISIDIKSLTKRLPTYVHNFRSRR
jgi:hypothetical protein